jgi:hypothetical protein
MVDVTVSVPPVWIVVVPFTVMLKAPIDRVPLVPSPTVSLAIGFVGDRFKVTVCPLRIRTVSFALDSPGTVIGGPHVDPPSVETSHVLVAFQFPVVTLLRYWLATRASAAKMITALTTSNM